MKKYLYILLSSLIIIITVTACFVIFSKIYKNEKNRISDLYKQESSEISILDRLSDDNLYPISTSGKTESKTDPPSHFMIKLLDNQIKISDAEGNTVYTTDFYCEGMEADDITILKEGIEIDSVEQAFQLLESFVS